MDNSTKDEDDAQQVINKYNKYRKQKLKLSKKPWEGPTHKRFSNYLDDDSDSASESQEEEEESSGETVKEKSPKRDDSSTEPLDSDNDNLILPISVVPDEEEQPRNFDLSESDEPEDPEEVRKFQEKLKSRRSRVINNQTNYSTISVRNRTVNHNWTTNTTTHRNLLDLSSSSDEDDDSVKFIMKNSDDEVESSSAVRNSPTKRRKLEDSSIQKNIEATSKEVTVTVPVPSSPSSIADVPPVINDIMPLPEVESIVVTTVDHKVTKSNRISTPKPTDLKASKLLNKKSLRRSKILPTDKPSSPKVQEKAVSSPKPATVKSPAKATTPKSVSKAKSKVANSSATASPSNLKSKEPSTLTAKHLASSKSAANSTASPTKFFKSKTAHSKPSQSPTKAPKDAPSVSDVYDDVGDTNILDQAIDDVPTMTSPDRSVRQTRNSLGQRSSLAPVTPTVSTDAGGRTGRQRSKNPTQNNNNKSLTRRSKRNQSLRSSPAKRAAVSPVRNLEQMNDRVEAAESQVQQTLVAAQTGQQATPPVHPIGQSVSPPAASDSAESAAVCGSGVRFVSENRPAEAQDPVQSCLIHQTPSFYSILWKLMPGVTNWSRTRGETCILVFEGTIEVEGNEYPRGHLLKLPADKTYTVRNVSSSSSAMFQVTEYL